MRVMTEKVDFTKYKNIGKVCCGYLNEAGFTKKSFEEADPEDIFLKCLPKIGAEKGLMTCYPQMFCCAIWGAQNEVAWGKIPEKEKKRFKKFGEDVKSGL